MKLKQNVKNLENKIIKIKGEGKFTPDHDKCSIFYVNVFFTVLGKSPESYFQWKHTLIFFI